MKEDDRVALLIDESALAVYKAVDLLFGDERAEKAISLLLASGLYVSQLPLALHLCRNSIEWFEYDATRWPEVLTERVFDHEASVGGY